MSEGWRLVSCARFWAAAEAEKDLGRNSGEERGDLVANDMGSRDPDFNRSKGGGFEENRESKRLLTLPTILTIGRVAAVPLFVMSRFFYSSSFFFIRGFTC